ncbi:uracil-DNA glycosylase [Candidatus Kaiserbacteria bacterium RIFCSPHIGHO2_02_FULL_49_34]|uniref:Uracil-DNA glycosylase n=1 Tax=Candidatus Kaiserbacteria bacterium RIFCSPHIGHO2_02_FULL_49_34 TaxID=1798491 RepID=A0A1F6DKG0_9BACT|nr:MAG: uracil-DNA glycosylase [Candidatus Kaiserbacteria bacterium RIFCSPHIGHO2_02_FULL_49_34]
MSKEWKEQLSEEMKKPYFVALMDFVDTAYKNGDVYPLREDLFAAFDATSFDNVRVVIVGQDPYHGDGEAHGLCFSVRNGVKTPPSLRNIFKEITAEYGNTPQSTDLSGWAKQGVLLLNATLTVEKDCAGSHTGRGWETFTDAILQKISDKKENVVFLLWGNYARKKGALIDHNKHLVLESAHPSPLSASRGFFGNNHFTTTNEYLEAHKKKPINWLL